jgi:hypothetical protein
MFRQLFPSAPELFIWATPKGFIASKYGGAETAIQFPWIR